MKRILILCGSSPESDRGGSSTFIKNLDQHLRKNYEIKYHFFPEYYQKFKFIPKRLVYFVYTFLTLPFLCRRFDMILSHSPEASFIVSFMNIPFIYIFHGNTNPVKISKYWYGKYFQFVFSFFDKRITKTAIKLFTVGEYREGCQKIQNPIPPKDIYKGERKNFYFVGRLEKVKNVFRIIDIYSNLDEKIKEQHKLIIIGEGTLKSDLNNYVLQLKIEKSVIFTGFLKNEETMQYLKTGKLLIMTSHHEGFPMAIAEALSFGLPIISTKVGDIPNIIKNGYNGFCLEPHVDNMVLIEKINEILNNYNTFSFNAFESSSIFNPELIAQQIIGSFGV